MAAAGHHNYTLRDNHIADLGTRQYVRDMVCTYTYLSNREREWFIIRFCLQVKLIPSSKRHVSKESMVGAAWGSHEARGHLPPEIDWRQKGFNTPVQNQKNCGSCYAYSIAGSIQGQIFKETGMLIPLSEQQLIDCSASTGNLGCAGGSLRNTLRYLEKAKGLMAQEQYPYKGKVCRLFFSR